MLKSPYWSLVPPAHGGSDAERQGDRARRAANQLDPSPHTQHPPARFCLWCLCFLLLAAQRRSFLLFLRMQLVVLFPFCSRISGPAQASPTGDSRCRNPQRGAVRSNYPTSIGCCFVDQPIALQMGQLQRHQKVETVRSLAVTASSIASSAWAIIRLPMHSSRTVYFTENTDSSG